MQTAERALVGAVGLIGTLVLADVLLKREQQSGNAAASQQLSQPTSTSSNPLLTGVLPTGTTAPAATSATDTAALIAEAQRQAQAAAAATLRQQQVDTLRRDLARIQNDIDVQVVQANAMKNRQPDSAFIQGISDRLWAECRNSGAWVSQAFRCNNANMDGKVQATVKSEWAAQQTALLQPIQAQLSRLNSEQLGTIDNLRALGVAVQAAEIKQVNV